MKISFNTLLIHYELIDNKLF